MSGPRPANLERRGAIYVVRFRIPTDLMMRLGMTEIRRSLQTTSAHLAKERCLSATGWFRGLMDKLREMDQPTRKDLEAAAKIFFDRLVAEVDVPRQIDLEEVSGEMAFNIEQTRHRISELEDALRLNQFDAGAAVRADQMLSAIKTSLDQLDGQARIMALQLSVKAERQQMRYLDHSLSTPQQTFHADDPVFADRDIERREATVSPPVASGRYPALGDLVDDCLERMKGRGLGASHVDEVGRVLSWLKEELGSAMPVDLITGDQMRTFRDNIQRMDRTRQGRSSKFSVRLTDTRDRQITSATAQKYWGGVQSFFSWAFSEGRMPTNPAALLKIETRKGEQPRSPEPFNQAELRRFFNTPLYQGYLSQHRVTTPGACRARGQHWWAGLLSLFTGLRAGELTQLLPSDFIFEDEIPHLRVHEVDGDGNRTKTTKTASSIRDVPLAPILLELGLRQFVERRKKAQPKGRVFERFRLGTGGKISEGMTRFWGDYLKTYGLHSPGRSTHVMRHTVIDRLRELEVPEEHVSMLVGHSGRTQTSKYGRKQILSLAKKAVDKLEYGFDLKAHVGGEYVHDIHLA